MSQNGKRYKELSKAYDRDKLYPPGEALTLVKDLAKAKFDETIELNMCLGIDTRKADQQVRGAVSLPRGTGRSVRVIVFAKADKAREAKEAGADEVGDDELGKRVEGGWTDFDVAIATPDMMPVVGKLGKILGPRGLMPNPKSGTVTNDVAKAVQDIKAGKIEYRSDRQSNVHTVIGKASFPVEALSENYLAVIEEILRAKPPAAKGKYLKSVALSSTMGPGIRIDPNRVKDAELASAGPASDSTNP
jgi:large subunit ribosomal protein L1